MTDSESNLLDEVEEQKLSSGRQQRMPRLSRDPYPPGSGRGAERAQPPSPRLRRTIVGLALLLLILFLAGYLPRVSRERSLETASHLEATRLPIVNVVEVKRSAPHADLLLPGDIQAITEAPILARANGYLRRREVDIGDRVQQGQLLAEIDAPEVDQQVAQARAALQQARAVLAQAEANLAQARANEELAAVTAQRWKTLAERGVVSPQENDQNQANYRAQAANRHAADAAVDAAKENVSASQANLIRLIELQGYEKVRAPCSGLITFRNVDVGALINGGNTLLFRMAQIDTLRIFVNVPQSYASGVRAGDRAEVSVLESRSRRFAGTVSRTANALDPNSRTLLTEVRVLNSDHALLPGMYAQVRMVSPLIDPPLLIPGDAVVAGSDGTKVAVLRDGQRVHFQPIEPGRDYGTEVEVLSGLASGDYVVVNPTDEVREGTQVKPVVQPRQPGSAPTSRPQPAGNTQSRPTPAYHQDDQGKSR